MKLYKQQLNFKGLVLFLIISLNPVFAFSQVQKDSLFLQYLVAKDEHRDVITFLSLLQNRYADSTQSRFEIPYWKGLSFYSLRSLDSCSYYLAKVSQSSPYYKKSLFLTGISHSYLRRFNQAENTLLKISSKDDSIHLATRTFELAGIALLKRDLYRFDSLKNHFSTQYYPLQKQQSNFDSYRDIIKKQQSKSAFKAALLSAIVPGMGKLYVGGQLGQGISTFLQNTILGLQAYEALRKDGVSSPRFIIYGGLFSVFYLGNIWGSALSVKIKRQEFNDKIDEQILFDMHIPLRTIFN